MWKQGTMRRHLPIVLASAALLAGAATGVAQAAPGAKGPRGGDAKALPGFVKKWEGEKQAAADLGRRTSASSTTRTCCSRRAAARTATRR